LYLLNPYRTRLDPPTGMLAGVLMGKVRDGIRTGVREHSEAGWRAPRSVSLTPMPTSDIKKMINGGRR
jgi:hypothetical protein